MTKVKKNDYCKIVKEKYDMLTPKQKIITNISAGAVVGLSLGVIIGLLLNKRR